MNDNSRHDRPRCLARVACTLTLQVRYTEVALATETPQERATGGSATPPVGPVPLGALALARALFGMYAHAQLLCSALSIMINDRSAASSLQSQIEGTDPTQKR